MNRKQVYGLILIALVALTLIFNTGKMELQLIFFEIDLLKSLALLIFTAVGVLIGLFLK